MTVTASNQNQVFYKGTTRFHTLSTRKNRQFTSKLLICRIPGEIRLVAVPGDLNLFAAVCIVTGGSAAAELVPGDRLVGTDFAGFQQR